MFVDLENIAYLGNIIYNIINNHRQQSTSENYVTSVLKELQKICKLDVLINKDIIINLIKNIICNKYSDGDNNSIYPIFVTNSRWDGHSVDISGEINIPNENGRPFMSSLITSASLFNEIDDFIIILSCKLFDLLENSSLLSSLNLRNPKPIKSYLLFSYDNYNWWDDEFRLYKCFHCELDLFNNFVIRSRLGCNFYSPHLLILNAKLNNIANKYKKKQTYKNAKSKSLGTIIFNNKKHTSKSIPTSTTKNQSLNFSTTNSSVKSNEPTTLPPMLPTALPATLHQTIPSRMKPVILVPKTRIANNLVKNIFKLNPSLNSFTTKDGFTYNRSQIGGKTKKKSSKYSRKQSRKQSSLL